MHQHQPPNVASFEKSKIDSDLRKHICITYRGACSLEYQQVIEIFYQLHVKLGPKKQHATGKRYFRRVLALAPTHKKLGHKTLCSHWQIWVDDLSLQVKPQFNPNTRTPGLGLVLNFREPSKKIFTTK